MKKSIARSLLIPGLGEYGLGMKKRGKLFSLTELSLWTVLILSQNISKYSEIQFKSLAARHAGADTKGKPDQYYVDIGNYENFEIYNETQQRYRRPDLVYPAELDYHWNWDSKVNRNRFKDYRIKRDLAKKVGRFTIGGILLNHIISAIDVTYLHRIKKSRQSMLIKPVIYPNTQEMRLLMTINL